MNPLYNAFGTPTLPRPKEPAFIDNPFAPELFATGYAGIANMGGNIVLTLESARCDHGGAQPVVERVVVGRIAMTADAAHQLVAGLNDFLAQQQRASVTQMAKGATFQ
ncbi:hypothetical protein ACQR50_07055 [Sphingomonas sp. Xoc002]|uniref:hypothetical protein n=1 Tax=Sphingomonas sp. Xoc002 TaxID=2837624 RepID=UPI003D17FC2C